MTSTRWPLVSKDEPCVICGHTNSCRNAPDKTAAVCWHNGNGGKVIQLGKVNGNGHRNLNGTSVYDRSSNNPKPSGGKFYPSAEVALKAAMSWKHPTAELAGVWTYPGGTFKIGRFNFPDGSKTCRPAHLTDEGWRSADPPGKLPLYRMDEIPDEEQFIFVPEGEKCCDLARSLGLTAVTSSHGAASADKTDWTLLAQLDALIVFLPDADAPGEKYAADATKLIFRSNANARIKILRLPDLPDGGDIEQYIDARDSLDGEAIAASIVYLADHVPLEANNQQGSTAGDEVDRFTEQGNAKKLVAAHGGKFRWSPERSSFLSYDDSTGRWVDDRTGVVERLTKSVASDFWGLVPDAAGPERKAIIKHATKSESAQGISAVMKLARTEPGITVLSGQLDSCIWSLNCKNGVLDLKTGRLMPHSPDCLITKLAPVDFDPLASCPTFIRFINRIMADNPELIGYLARVLGMSITGDVSTQELFVFFGNGANGKSVLVDTFAGLMGDYAGQAPPALLTIKTNEEHPTEVADLMGRRLVFASETEEGAKLKIQLVKRLTGDGTLKARYMRGNYFEFARTFKLILATNNKPRISENTNAVWRRLRLIPFSVVIPAAEQDVHLLDKLRDEWPGILAWAVRGCLEWQKNGMQTPAAVLQATNEYQSEQDVLGEYLTARCSLNDPRLKIARSELFGDYLSWAHQSGERFPLDRNSFFERVRRVAGVGDKSWKPAGQTVPVRGFTGIALAFNAQFNGESGDQ